MRAFTCLRVDAKCSTDIDVPVGLSAKRMRGVDLNLFTRAARIVVIERAG